MALFSTEFYYYLSIVSSILLTNATKRMKTRNLIEAQVSKFELIQNVFFGDKFYFNTLRFDWSFDRPHEFNNEEQQQKFSFRL